MAPRRQKANASTLRRPAAAPRSRKSQRVASKAPLTYDQWLDCHPGETPEQELKSLDVDIHGLSTKTESTRRSLQQALQAFGDATNELQWMEDRRVEIMAVIATRRSGAPETRGSGP